MKLRECPLNNGQTLDCPEKAYEFWMTNVPNAPWYLDEQEMAVVFYLNTRKHVVGFNLISIGDMDTLLIHPREVFRLAIVASAAAIIIAHNHPSGDPSPSQGDIKVTRDLIRAGQLLKIDLLDHIVIGRPTVDRPQPYVSLRELGFFYS